MSEYERLKKQRDEIIIKHAHATAEKIVDDIMTDSGNRRKAHRLVLTDRNDRPGSGWSRDALVRRIEVHLSNDSALRISGPSRDRGLQEPLLGTFGKIKSRGK